MTCKYCPIAYRCKHKKEGTEESIWKRFLDYIFKSDTYSNCRWYQEDKVLEPARKTLRELGIEPDW